MIFMAIFTIFMDNAHSKELLRSSVDTRLSSVDITPCVVALQGRVTPGGLMNPKGLATSCDWTDRQTLSLSLFEGSSY